MRMPFSRGEFVDPEKAIRRLGFEAAIQTYRLEVEPRYRQDQMPGLPRDWQWRKLLVHRLASGRCSHCGRQVPPTTDPHHVIFRGHGGDHSLENLKLLCWRCHKEQHPERAKGKRSIQDIEDLLS